MNKEYKSSIQSKAAKPRSKRLREAGVGGSSSSSITVTGAGGGGSAELDHTHNNLDTLDKLSRDSENYLRMQQVSEDAAGGTVVSQERVKAGFADLADDLLKDGKAVEWLKELFVRKDIPETLVHLLKLQKGAEFGEYLAGMIGGKGAGCDDRGNFEMESLKVRGSMTIMELIINRLQAMESDYSFSAAGTIERVVLEPDGTYTLYLRKNHENDFTALGEHDVVYGSVNDLFNTGYVYNSWMRVLAVNTTLNTISTVLYPDAEVPGGKNYAPTELMVISHRGNPINEDRQGYWYLSSGEGCICMLDGVTKPILEEYNYAVILGKLKNLSIFDNIPINYRHSYMYCRGIAVQEIFKVDYNGVPIAQYVDRGDWSLEIAISEVPYNCTPSLVDTVWHLGCLWHCLVTGTTDAPRFGSTGWAMKQGNPSFTIDIDSTNGFYFDMDRISYDSIFTTLFITGELYNQDVTENILDGDVTWTRDTGNITEDNAWAVKRAEAGKELTLTLNDLGTDYVNMTSCKFKATALLRDGQTFDIATNYITF